MLVFFPKATFTTYAAGGIKNVDVKNYLKDALDKLEARLDIDATVVAKAFLLYTIGHMFFPNANSTIVVGYLAYVENLEVVETYDWGTAILARVYYALDKCSKGGQRSMDCFWQLIEVWKTFA